jgi:hypothetical protein
VLEHDGVSDAFTAPVATSTSFHATVRSELEQVEKSTCRAPAVTVVNS